MDAAVFDRSNYASTAWQKLVRTLQLGPKYYLSDLPRYFVHRAQVGLRPLDLGAIVNPLFEYARAGRSGPFPPVPGYHDAIAAFRAAGVRINLPPLRFAAVASAWWATRAVEGDVIECGSYKGATALFLAVLGARHGPRQTVHLLDTFSGMPAVSRHDLGRVAGEHDTGPGIIERIRAHARSLGVGDAIRIHAGLFADTFASWHGPANFRFAHIDANIYASTYEACAFVHPRMTRGGIIVFDDHNSSQDLGARLAIDLYFRGTSARIARLAGSSGYLRIAEGEPWP